MNFKVTLAVYNVFYVFKGKIFDGCKIALFTCIFSESDSGSTTEPLLNLSINGVRKASNQAHLGYIHPSYLRRGLSVKSLVLGIN